MSLREDQYADNKIELYFRDEVYAIMGAAIEVHRTLGSGFLEAVYQEALEWELKQRGVPMKPQKVLQIHYKDQLLRKTYVADIICYNSIILELKSQDKLYPRDEAQLINYLKATRMKLGLLINFGSKGKLEWQRRAN